MIAVTIYDESTSGSRRKAVTLHLASERITVRDLIERRVRKEVEEHNRTPLQEYFGLVQPRAEERALNPDRSRPKRPLDPGKQCAAALEAFRNNGFLLLVGDRQPAGLDDEVVLTPETDIRFLKLVPLVGG